MNRNFGIPWIRERTNNLSIFPVYSGRFIFQILRRSFFVVNNEQSLVENGTGIAERRHRSNFPHSSERNRGRHRQLYITRHAGRSSSIRRQAAVRTRVVKMAGVLFEDIFNVKDIDPEGKKFDRGESTLSFMLRYVRETHNAGAIFAVGVAGTSRAGRATLPIASARHAWRERSITPVARLSLPVLSPTDGRTMLLRDHASATPCYTYTENAGRPTRAVGDGGSFERADEASLRWSIRRICAF